MRVVAERQRGLTATGADLGVQRLQAHGTGAYRFAQRLGFQLAPLQTFGVGGRQLGPTLQQIGKGAGEPERIAPLPVSHACCGS